ncbi:MAG: response regulator [Planctomycetota bacterium]|nr:MAG: response regulator [Planctomycetota bacterium]
MEPLPFDDEHREDDSVRPPDDGDSDEDSRRVRHVLLIEDDPIDAIMIRRSLRDAEDAQYVLEHVTRLDDGLQRLGRGTYHLVLLDLMLPDSTGLATFRTLRERFPETPAIVLSGLDDRQLGRQATELGALDYLVKGDITPTLLQRSIRHARARHKTLRQLAHLADELQQQRNLLESVLGSMDEAVIVVGRDGRITPMNPAARRVVGRGAPAGARNWSQMFGLYLPDGSTPLAEEQSPFTLACRGDNADGIELFVRNERIREGMPVSASVRPLKSADGSIGGGVVVFTDITARQRAERERMQRIAVEREIELAWEVQKGLFPESLPSIDGFDIAARVQPAHLASGDYYDFLEREDGRLGVLLADISGHGLGPALLMAQTRTIVHVLASQCRQPSELLRAVNRYIWKADDAARFLTMFAGCLEAGTRTLHYASAGHPGFLVSADGATRHLDSTGTVLGLFPDTQFETAEIRLRGGDILFLPTDGIYEAHRPGGPLFGIDRMLDVVRQHRHLRATELIDHVIDQAARLLGDSPPKDDMSAVVIKVR